MPGASGELLFYKLLFGEGHHLYECLIGKLDVRTGQRLNECLMCSKMVRGMMILSGMERLRSKGVEAGSRLRGD